MQCANWWLKNLLPSQVYFFHSIVLVNDLIVFDQFFMSVEMFLAEIANFHKRDFT